MSFITYEFYTNKYGGDLIPSNKFKRISIKATAYINAITFNRIDENSISENIRLAVCEVAESIYSVEKNGGIKSSETVGKHSVSYKTEDINTNKELYNIAKLYLANTGLLYRGIR